jgi:hypothetical protein
MIKQLKDQSKLMDDFKPIAKYVKNIPLIKSFDEVKNHEFKQFLIQEDDGNVHLQQLIKFIHKQSKLSGWILLGILILSSTILSCKFLGLF